jgi:hypothetical protein
MLFSQYPGKYTAGSSRIYLTQSNGSQIVGTFAVNPLDVSLLQINWDLRSLTTNTGIDSLGRLDFPGTAHDTPGYNASTSNRPSSPGTFDAIINPQTYNPKRPTGTEDFDQTVSVGTRFLLVEDIGDLENEDGADAWKSSGGDDLVAQANDIIEWTGNEWNVIFNSGQETTTMVWQTNIYTGVQYLWNGVSWVKSFEGEYSSDKWKIVL